MMIVGHDDTDFCNEKHTTRVYVLARQLHIFMHSEDFHAYWFGMILVLAQGRSSL